VVKLGFLNYNILLNKNYGSQMSLPALLNGQRFTVSVSTCSFDLIKADNTFKALHLHCQ
jgi:hypothetical protein